MPIAIDCLFDACGVPRRRPAHHRRSRPAAALWAAESLELRRVLAVTVNYASEVLSVTFDDAADDTLELSVTSTGYATQGSTPVSGTGTVRQVIVTDAGTSKSSQFSLVQANQTLTGGISIAANITTAAITVPVATGGGNVLIQSPAVLSHITLDTGSGDQTYSGPVTLTGDVTLSAVGGGDISFSGGVTTQAGSTAGLSINAGSQGAVTFETAAATIAGSVVVTARNIVIKDDLVSTSGDISLVGYALTATPVAGTFHGVWVNGSGVKVATRAENLLDGASGSIFISGRGGDAVTAGPPTGRVYGVYVQAGAAISAGGAGSVTVRGTGGISTASSFSTGVLLSNSDAANGVSEIRSAGGDIYVDGTGGGAPSSNSNAGVQVNNFGRIAAGGSGRVTVIGTGTSTGGSGTGGVVVANGNAALAAPTAAITSDGGGILVLGTAADGAADVALVNEGRIASGGSAAVAIIADSLTIGTNSAIGAGRITAGAAGDSTLEIVPRTVGTRIDLGGDDVRTGATRTLGLSVAEIGRLRADNLFVGLPGKAGPIRVSQAIAPTDLASLTLRTSAGLVLEADVTTASDQYYEADVTLARDVRLASETRSLDLAEVGSFATTSSARAVALSADGRLAYVADATSGLVILDLSDPAQPTPISAIDTLGSANDVVLSADGATAYVTAGASGLRVIDVSDPRSPQLRGSVATGTAANVAVVPGGQYVAVTSSSGGLFMVDVLDAAAPTVDGSYMGTLQGSAGVTVSADGSLIYLCDFNDGLVVLDIADPATPVLHDTLNLGMAGVAADVAISPFGNLAYVTDTRGQLWVVDVSNTFNLTTLSTLSRPDGGGYLGLEVSADGETVFIATFDNGVVAANGLVAVDVSDPTAPVVVDTLPLAAPAFAPALSPSGTMAAVADGSGGLRIVDLSTATPSNGQLTFAGTLNGPAIGAAGLSVVTSSTISFMAALGDQHPLTRLTTAGTAVLADDLTVAGPAVFGGNVTLTADVTLTGRSDASAESASVSFGGGIAGARALMIRDGDTAPSVGLGEVRFGGAVGSLALPLTSLSIEAPGAAVESAGRTIHAGTIDLASDSLILGSLVAGVGGIGLEAGAFAAIAGTVTSGGAFTTTGTAGTTFSLTSLGNLSLTAVGVTFGGPMTVGGFNNPTLSITSGNQPITFNGSINACGSTSVALDAGGNGDILFGGPVQGFTGLTVANARNVTAQAAITGVGAVVQAAGSGTTTLANVTTTGAQSYTAAAVRLGGSTYDTGGGGFSVTGPTTLTAAVAISAGAGAIAFTGTLDGGHALVLASTSTTALGGIVGGGTALASLTTDAGGSIRLWADVTTTGAQVFGESTIVLGADVVLTGATGSFTGFTGNDRNLTLNFGGVTTLDGARLTGLRNLTTGGGGITRLSGSLTTGGVQAYAEAVELAGPVTLDTAAANAGVSLIGGSAGIYAASGSGGSLVVRAGTGAIDLGGAAGFGTGSGAGSLVGDVTLTGGAIRLVSGDNTVAGTLAVAAGSIGGTATLGSLSLDPAGQRLVHVTGTAPVTGYDQFVIAADRSVALDGATLTVTAATMVDVGTVLTLVENRGSAPVAGRFAGLPEGAFVTAGQNVFTISYVGGDGNDVTLTATAADATVSVVDDVVTIALGPDGATITNFSTRFDRRAGTLLITLTGSGVIEGGGPGVTVLPGTEAVRVNLAELPGFGGIAVRGGPGTERITVGRQGIDLAAVRRGGPDQSLTIDTGPGTEDAVVATTLLSTKGAGGLTLTTSGVGEAGGVRLGGQLRSLDGSQMIAGATLLLTETKLTAGGAVTFADTLDGGHRLSISTGGAVTFAGDVGVAAPLAGVALARATSVSVQAGFALDGTRAGRRASGLTIGRRVNDIVFAALGTDLETTRTIRGFGGSGVRFQGGSTGSVLAGLNLVGNTVGISVAAGDYAGSALRGNAIEASRQVGIDLRSARGLLVGGTEPSAGNRIASATSLYAASIGIRATGTLTGTRLEGNVIGGNSGSGVVLAAARTIKVGGAAAGAGNAIDGNRNFGLLANGRCDGSIVEGNSLDGNGRGPLNVRLARGLTVVGEG